MRANQRCTKADESKALNESEEQENLDPDRLPFELVVVDANIIWLKRLAFLRGGQGFVLRRGLHERDLVENPAMTPFSCNPAGKCVATSDGLTADEAGDENESPE